MQLQFLTIINIMKNNQYKQKNPFYITLIIIISLAIIALLLITTKVIF